MKIAILGSTGFVGKTLVKKALQAGYSVKALARDPGRLEEFRDQIEMVIGDLSDSVVLSKLVAGTDAVLSAAGPANTPDQPELFKRIMTNLVEAMNQEGVKRFIMISGGTLPLPDEKLDFQRRLMTVIMKLMGKYVYEAKVQEFAVLSRSSLNWTSIRAPMIAKDPPSGKVAADDQKSLGMKIMVEDLAQFMLDQITEKRWVKKAPFVASVGK